MKLTLLSSKAKHPKVRIRLSPSELTCNLSLSKKSSVLIHVSHLLKSSQNQHWESVKNTKNPQSHAQSSGKEKSPLITSILITLRFLLTLNAAESGWWKRGWVFFPPLHPCFCHFYPFSSSGLLPAGFDSESVSHHRRPVPRLTKQPAHCKHVFITSSSTVPSRLTVWTLFFSKQTSSFSSSHSACCVSGR